MLSFEITQGLKPYLAPLLGGVEQSVTILSIVSYPQEHHLLQVYTRVLPVPSMLLVQRERVVASLYSNREKEVEAPEPHLIYNPGEVDEMAI